MTASEPVISINTDETKNNATIINVESELETGTALNVEDSDHQFGNKECDIFTALWKKFKIKMSQIEKTDKEDFIADIKECCRFKHDFDVYQVLAFDSTKSDRNILELWQYRLKCMKGFLCAFTQISAMIIVLYQLILSGVKDKQWCWNYDPNIWYMNVLAFLLSTYLAYTTIRELSDTKGLYQYVLLRGITLKWIDHGWLYFGFVVNTIAATCAVWGSYFIIFFSSSAVDMVLNSVALFFLVELDDLLVDEEDYENVAQAIENKFDKRNKNKGRLKKWFETPCDKVAECVIILIGIPFVFIRLITICGCVVFPIYIAICF